MDNSSPDSLPALCGYVTRHESWKIAGQMFDLTWPADIDALLDSPDTHQRFKKDEYMPYWAVPWPSSVHLARKVLKTPAGEGRKAVEIGCGVGLVSVAAAMMGWSVWASDYDPVAVQYAQHNARANGVELATAEPLDYRERLLAPRFHLILGSDLLYERRCAQPVAAWICSALLPEGEAWLSDPNRSAADDFPDIARRQGLQVDVEQTETAEPAGLISRARIWRLRWPDSAR